MRRRQWGIRVGAPVVNNQRGLAVLAIVLPLWVIIGAFIGTFIEFGAFVYSLSCGDCAFRGRGDGGTF